MKKRETVELSSCQATAYWWINVITRKVKEIRIEGGRSKEECRFAEIFSIYTEVEWRKLYLELVKYIDEDVRSYQKREISSYSYIDAFHQDTDQNGHDQLNRELSEIIKQEIPDIRLASYNEKDSVIYTDQKRANIWYKSCGMNYLPQAYETDYILTGDERKRNFYNLLVSTIVVLSREDEDFCSTAIFRQRFCEEYKMSSTIEENIEELQELFNHAFDRASSQGIVIGRHFKGIYFPSFHDIDLIGLDPYMEQARHYANVVLQRKEDSRSFCKRMKEVSNTNRLD